MSLTSALQNVNLDQLTKTALGGADTSGVAAAAGQLQKIEKDKEAATGPEIEKIKKDAASDKATADTKYQGIEPVDVQKWDAQKEKAKYSTDPVQAFGSAGSLFAIAASAFTHTPITNALNGAAAAMNAIKAKDEKGYQDAYTAWQDNTKLALERHNAQHEDYTDALEKMKTDFAQGQALLTMTAAKYGDQATATMNQAGLLENVAQLQDARARSAQSLLEAFPGLQEKNLTVQGAFALQNAQKDLDAAKASGIPEDIVKATAKMQTTQAQVAALHSALNPYSSTGTLEKTQLPQLQHDAIEEGWANKAKELGRDLTANERLDIANKVLSGGKAKGSVQSQLLSDFKDDFARVNGRPPTADEEAKAVEGWKNAEPTLTDQAVDKMVDRFLAGDGSVTQNMGRGSQGAANVVKFQNRLAERMDNAGITGADQANMVAKYKALTASYRSLGTKDAQLTNAREELNAFVPQALEASKALPRTQYPSLNSVIQAAQAGTGDPRVRDLALTLQAVKTAYSVVIARGGAPTDASRGEADALFSRTDSEEVLRTVLARVEKESSQAAGAPQAAMSSIWNLFNGGKPGAPQPGIGAAPAGGGDSDFSHLWSGGP